MKVYRFEGWINQLALDISLDEVTEANLTKLLDRQTRGKIKGKGDYR